jgi:hypothetical protein
MGATCTFEIEHSFDLRATGKAVFVFAALGFFRSVSRWYWFFCLHSLQLLFFLFRALIECPFDPSRLPWSGFLRSVNMMRLLFGCERPYVLFFVLSLLVFLRWTEKGRAFKASPGAPA